MYWILKFLFFAGLLVLQAMAYLATALGCGDDGPVDYGTATDLQQRFCHAATRAESSLTMLFIVPLIAFALAAILTIKPWVPLLVALPFVLLSSAPVLAVMAPGALVLMVVVVAVPGAIVLLVTLGGGPRETGMTADQLRVLRVLRAIGGVATREELRDAIGAFNEDVLQELVRLGFVRPRRGADASGASRFESAPEEFVVTKRGGKALRA